MDGLFCNLPLTNQCLALKRLAIYDLGYSLLANLLLGMVLPYHNVGCKELLEVSGPISLLKAGLLPKPGHVHAITL